MNLLLSPQKCQCVPFFPDLSQFTTFAAAPLVLTPFVRNQPLSPLDRPDTGACIVSMPFLKETLGKMASQGTKSGAGERSLLWDCRAKARLRGVADYRHQYGTPLKSRFRVRGFGRAAAPGPSRTAARAPATGRREEM